jgi:hypothetical protein
MELKYVTFEQGKWLLEKDYPPTAKCFNEEGKECTVSVIVRRITDSTYYPRPEQHQVVDWLLEKYSIWVTVKREYHNGALLGFESIIDTNEGFIDCGTFDTPRQAYSAAFNYIKDNIKL